MEKKKDFIKAINYAKYLAFILATICVFVFQFIAAPICITLGLALYVVAFGLMFASLVVHSVEIYSADKLIKSNNLVAIEPKNDKEKVVLAEEGELKGENVEVVSLKSEKVWSIIGAVFFGLFTIFTFIVLVLY